MKLIDQERQRFEEVELGSFKEKEKLVFVPAIMNKQAPLYGYLLAATNRKPSIVF